MENFNETWNFKISDFAIRDYRKAKKMKNFISRNRNSLTNFSNCCLTKDQSGQDKKIEYWLSREVLNGKEYTKKDDIYSFGVLLWEIISGEIPYGN